MSDISFVEKANHLAAKQVRWRTTVGRFLLAFGEIEWFTYHMLSELPTERIFESTVNLRFAQRVGVVSQLLHAKDISDELKDEANRLLEHAI